MKLTYNNCLDLFEAAKNMAVKLARHQRKCQRRIHPAVVRPGKFSVEKSCRRESIGQLFDRWLEKSKRPALRPALFVFDHAGIILLGLGYRGGGRTGRHRVLLGGGGAARGGIGLLVVHRGAGGQGHEGNGREAGEDQFFHKCDVCSVDCFTGQDYGTA